MSPRTTKNLLLTAWLAGPFAVLAVILWLVVVFLGKPKMLATARGPGAGDTGGANALGEWLAGRNPEVQAAAQQALREGRLIDPTRWPGPVEVVVPAGVVHAVAALAATEPAAAPAAPAAAAAPALLFFRLDGTEAVFRTLVAERDAAGEPTAYIARLGAGELQAGEPVYVVPGRGVRIERPGGRPRVILSNPGDADARGENGAAGDAPHVELPARLLPAVDAATVDGSGTVRVRLPADAAASSDNAAGEGSAVGGR